MEPEEAISYLYDNNLLSSLDERINLMARVAHSNEPFPSSPQRPPTHVVYFRRGSSISTHGFCKAYAARAMIDLVTNGYDFRWDSETVLRIDEINLIISSDKLEEIMEDETQFELPHPYPNMARDLRNEPRPPYEPMTTSIPKKPTNPSATGDITPQHLSDHLSIAPQKVRQKLRKLGLPKPYRWATIEEAVKAYNS